MTQKTVLGQLMEVIRQRKLHRPAGSYTTQLIEGGVERIGAKVLEEAAEVVEAARREPDDRDGVVPEAADLIYHLLVLVAFCDRDLADVEKELARRFGVSGLEEKAARNRPA